MIRELQLWSFMACCSGFYTLKFRPLALASLCRGLAEEARGGEGRGGRKAGLWWSGIRKWWERVGVFFFRSEGDVKGRRERKKWMGERMGRGLLEKSSEKEKCIKKKQF